MADVTYKVEVTRKHYKDITITVSDDIPQEDLEEWCRENDHEIFEISGQETWDVDDLTDQENGPSYKVTISSTAMEDTEIDFEDFRKKEKK